MSNHFKLWTMGALLALSVIMAKQLVLVGFHPVYLAMLQTSGSVIFLAMLGTKNLRVSLHGNVPYYLWASMLGFTVPQLIVFYSVQHLGASVVALAYAFPLLITFSLTMLLSKNRLELKPVVYILGAFGGSLLYLYKPDVLNFSADQLNWLVLLGLVPITLSIANIYRSMRWPVDAPIYHVALLTNLFSFLSYALFAAFNMPALPDTSKFSQESLAVLMVFMFIASAGQYLLFSLQKAATPSFVGQTGSITAFCGGLMGFLFFQESYQLSTLLGSLLILFGVAGFSRQQVANPAK